jgi:hypothetical protein
MTGGSRFRRGLAALLTGVLMTVASIPALAGPVPMPDPPERMGPGTAGLQSPSPVGRAQAGAAQAFSRLPFYFTENRGQLDGRIKYYEQGRGRAVYFTPAGIEFALVQEPDSGEGPGPPCVLSKNALRQRESNRLFLLAGC